MKVDIRETGPCSRHLAVEVPEEKVKSTVDDYFRKVLRELVIPGFRPGRVPRKIAEKKFGNKIREEVKNELLENSLREAFEEHKIRALGEPEIKNTDFAPDKAMSFEVETEVEPEFELPDFRKFEIPRRKEDVSEEEVNTTIESLRQRMGQYNPVEDRASAEGDFIIGEITLTENDTEVLQEMVTAKVGDDTLNGIYKIKEGSEKLAGLNKEETAEFDVEVPEDRKLEKMEGTQAACSLRIDRIMNAEIPELTDKFAADLGMENVAKLTDTVRQRLKTEKETRVDQEVERRIVDKLLESVDIELPEKSLTRIRENIRQNAEQRIQQLPPDQQKTERENLEQNLNEQAIESLKTYMILTRIAEAEKIQVDRQDILNSVSRMSDRTGQAPQKVVQELAKNQQLESLHSEILDRKVLDFLKKNVQIKEETSTDAEENDQNE